MKRPRRNSAERQFEEWATGAGWSISKRGWPDFWCMTPGGFVAVEVKPDNKNGTQGCLKASQRKVMDILSAHGIQVRVWSPRRGITEIDCARISKKFKEAV